MRIFAILKLSVALSRIRSRIVSRSTTPRFIVLPAKIHEPWPNHGDGTPNGIIPAAIWRRLSRLKMKGCDVAHSPLRMGNVVFQPLTDMQRRRSESTRLGVRA